MLASFSPFYSFYRSVTQDGYLSELSDEALDAGRQAVASLRREAAARMRDSASAAWREVVEQTYHFYRQEEELFELARISAEDVLHFYRSTVRRFGLNRRNIVLSVGPDAILNRLDGVECPGPQWKNNKYTLNVTLRAISTFPGYSPQAVRALQYRCHPHPALRAEEVSRWCRRIFSQGEDGRREGGGGGAQQHPAPVDPDLYRPPRPEAEVKEEEGEAAAVTEEEGGQAGKPEEEDEV